MTRWVMERRTNEGTSSPYMARLILGVLEMRDMVISHVLRKDHYVWRGHFDDLYVPVQDAMGAARKHSARVVELVATHRAKIESGEIVSYGHNAVYINESISEPLGEAFASFVTSAVRAVKLHQDVLAFLDLDVGFLFAKPASFEAGVKKLRESGQEILGDYLDATRAGWSERLINRRNKLEHEGWRLDDVLHPPAPNGVPRMVEPEVEGVLVSEWVPEMLGHVLAFVEEAVAYAVQRIMAPNNAALAEYPLESRDPTIVRRFYVVWPSLEPAKLWQLRYVPEGFPHS